MMLWKQLKLVSRMAFRTQSVKQNSRRKTSGAGAVNVDHRGKNTIIFNESGTVHMQCGKDICFSNRYRWTASADRHRIQLEHLRYGENAPVVLVELMKQSDTSWGSIRPHICNNDRYSLNIKSALTAIEMIWDIRGPDKSDLIHYCYFFD